MSTNEFFSLHGGILWLAWGVLSLLLIASIRYMKPCYKTNMIIHWVTGLLILLATLVMGIMANSYVTHGHKNKVQRAHIKIASPIYYITLIVVILGLVTLILKKKLAWNSKWILRMILVHKFLGYGLIILS